MKLTLKLQLFSLIIIFFFLSSSSYAQKNNKIKVGYLPMVSSLTHFVASEKGYYTEQGLEIDASPVKTSNMLAQDLVAGHVDVGIELSIVPLLKALELSPNSAKIFSISSITSENGFDGIVVNSKSTISKIEDLSERKVGVFPGTTAKNSFTEVFHTSFSKLKLPTFIELDPPLHIQALESGDIDALFTYEPNLSLGIVNKGFKKIANSIYAMQYSPNPIGVGVLNGKWLEKNPKLAKDFLSAIDKAVEFINSHPLEAKLILAKATKLDEKVVNTMNIMPLSLSSKIDFINLNGYLAVLKKIGEIKETPDPKDICIK